MGPTARVLLATALTTAVVTAASYGLPERHAATGVGLAFLAATYLLVLRKDAAFIRAHGLSLGGLLEPGAIDPRKLLRDGASATLWAVGLAAILFPPFWIGFVLWWHPDKTFAFVGPTSYFDDVLGQVMVIALPEEAFYRGYLQPSLERAWSAPKAEAVPPSSADAPYRGHNPSSPAMRPRGTFRLLGAQVGWAIPATSAMFAFGHFLTEPNPQRLAVFFPSLMFGWLRNRTGGIGAAIALHAMANLFSATLGRGYGLFH
jgi:CAAX protease family protein